MSKATLFQHPRGTRDFLPEEMMRRRYGESVIRQVFEKYGYQEIMTPIFEYFDLYKKRSGEKIRDEIYVFPGHPRERDDGFGIPPEYALRPELTAPACRMLISGGLSTWPRPVKIYYIGQCFRYDRPAPGRYREFWQAGIEVFGSEFPESDAEVIAVAANTLEELGLVTYELRIGTLGVLRGILSENGVNEETQNRIAGWIDKAASNINKIKGGEPVTDDRGQSMSELGVLQLLDEELYNIGVRGNVKDKVLKVFELVGTGQEVLKNAKEIFNECKNAMQALDHLSASLNALEMLKVPSYVVDLSVARGLDFYTGTVFEFNIASLGAQKQVCGGGRYDNLVHEYGGPKIPATGFAFGLDRLVEAISREGVKVPTTTRCHVVVIATTQEVRNKTLEIANMLRSKGVRVETDLMRRSLNEMLSLANRFGTPYAVIVGPKELSTGKVIMRNLLEKKQEEISLEDVANRIKKNLNLG